MRTFSKFRKYHENFTKKISLRLLNLGCGKHFRADWVAPVVANAIAECLFEVLDQLTHRKSGGDMLRYV